MENKHKTGEQKLLSLDLLYPFKQHPFKRYYEDKMDELTASVKEHGILTPILVRPRKDGGYEIISGHNRVEAAELAGMENIPANIREMNDVEAVLMMIDSNFNQRESLFPSEKAKAYKMKYETIKRQGERSDLTSRQLVAKLENNLNNDDSIRQIQRYIRLTHLVPTLLEKVDLEEIGFTAAVEVSYLKEMEQIDLVCILENEELPLSLAQAKQMKELSRKGKLSEEMIEAILLTEKPSQRKVTIKGDTLNQYFPKDITPRQMEETIVELLKQWKKKEDRKNIISKER